jgi:hypothetical protein
MVISTQKEFRCNGYATKLLNGFVERVKLETKNTNKKVKIILSSLDEVISYYQKYKYYKLILLNKKEVNISCLICDNLELFFTEEKIKRKKKFLPLIN